MIYARCVSPFRQELNEIYATCIAKKKYICESVVLFLTSTDSLRSIGTPEKKQAALHREAPKRGEIIHTIIHMIRANA
jgi:hypothetical protein